MFSPSSYRTPRKPVTPSRFQMWNTPTPRKTPSPSAFLTSGRRRRPTTSIIARNPALRGYARTAGVWGRFGPESKFIDADLSVNAFPHNNAFGIASLVPIPIGDGPSARIGRSVTVTSVQLMYTIDLHHTETNVVYLRVMLVLDKQCNGTPATWTMVQNALGMFSYRNLDNSDRFTVLYDKTHRNSPSALVAAGYTRYQGPNLKQVYRKTNIPINYDNTAATGAIATIRSNNLVLLAIPYGAATALNDFKCLGRIRYRDD